MNLSKFEQLERLAERDAKRLTTSPPKVEEISSREIYLLDEQERRVKRICGTMDGEWPCTISAGSGTLHEGIGKCRRHENSLTGKKEYLERYLTTLDSDSELTHFFESASQAEEDFFSVENLARMVSGVLHHFITSAQYNWTKKDIDRFLDMIEIWRKLIETQQKKEMNKVLATSISLWLRGVLSVIFNNVSSENYNKIVSQISTIELPKEIQEIEFTEVKS